MATFNSNYTKDNFETMCLITQTPIINGYHESQTLTNSNVYGIRYNNIDYYFLGGKILYKHIMRANATNYGYNIVILTDKPTKFSNILEALQSDYVWCKNVKNDDCYNVNNIRIFSGAYYYIDYCNANGYKSDVINTSIPFNSYIIERLKG